MGKATNINGSAKIDGKVIKIRSGQTVFEAAKKAEIYIPSLCYLENLKPYGGCRLCIVDIKNMRGHPTACTTPIEPGMEIKTKTRELQELRKGILEFTLSEHPYTCLVCGDKMECTDYMRTTRKVGTITGCNFCTSNGDCELQELVDYLELNEIKFPISYRAIDPDKNNPFYDLDYNLCILCGRCVRICSEERNSNVLAFVERGNNTIVGTAFNESQKEAGCEFCGACVDVCPTGSISEKMGKWSGLPARSVETTCTVCSVGCKMNVNTRNGTVINIGPKPGKRVDPPQLCIRGKFIPPDIISHPERILTPRIKRKNKWVEVHWKEAIEYTASNLEKYRGNQFGLIGSGQDTLEENYILQKFSRKVMRSNNIDLHNSMIEKLIPDSVLSHKSLYGSPDLKDIEKSDTLLIIGADASESHPLAENRIRKAFMNGKTVIYANSRSTRTSNFATFEVNYIPGKESSFLYSIVGGLVKKNASGLADSIKKQFTDSSLNKAAENSGSDKTRIEKIIAHLAKAKNLLIITGDDLMRNPDPLNTINCLLNIHYIKTRKNRCRIMFLENEGSLTGGILSGMHPDYLPGFMSLKKEKHLQKWNKNWDTKLSAIKGLQANEMVENIRDDGITSMFVTGHIPGHANLKNLKFLVQCNMFMTGLSESANVFLPLTYFLENEGHFITLEGKTSNVKQVVARPGSARPVTRIISDLASAMQETGFSPYQPRDVFRELSDYIDLPFPKQKAGKPVFQPVKPGSKKEAFEPIEYNHYRYRGNNLIELVDDLKKITDG